MKNNIALIGFMGTGKSAIGQAVANKLGWQFVEVDTMIEQMAGKAIPDIFAQSGEIAFRELEIEAVKRAAIGKKQVIACGGGVVLNTINIARLRETSVLVLLTASPATILKRTSQSGNTRPLLAGADISVERIKELLDYREPYYQRAADMTINTTKLNINAAADVIIEKSRAYESINFTK
jgi:shikimate kinase